MANLIDLVGKQVGGRWVYPRVEEEPGSYRVTLAVMLGLQEPDREPEGLASEALDAVLMDERERELEVAERPAPGALPLVGGPGVHAAATFRYQRSDVPAAVLRVRLDGETATFSLAGERAKPKKAEAPAGIWFLPLLRWLGPVEQASREAVHWLLRVARIEKERKRRCCVISFNVPANRSGCQTGANFTRESFDMLATFSNDGSCDCGCCEYRQYVRGYVLLNGADSPLPLPDGGLSRTTWREDGVPNHYGAGVHFRYGHRSLPGTGTDQYTNPDRAGGCDYHGWDRPGWSNLPAGSTARVRLQFRGVIIDTCRKNKVKRTSTWAVDCSFP